MKTYLTDTDIARLREVALARGDRKLLGCVSEAIRGVLAGYTDCLKIWNEMFPEAHASGCSGDCDVMPDGHLACATPIDEVGS